MTGLLIAGVAALYLVYGLLLWRIQEAVLFPAPDAPAAVLAEAAAGAGAQELWLPVRPDSGYIGKIYTWYLPPDPGSPSGDAPAGLVIYNHGNAEDLRNRTSLYRHLNRRGWGVLAISCPGYPGTPGAPSEAGMRAAVLAAWDHATGPLGVPAGRVVLHGYSMGGGAMGTALGAVQPGGLVLESTFASITDMGRRFAPLHPVRLLLRHPLRTIDRIGQLRAPALILHGSLDRLIPVDHGRRLAAALPGAVFVEVPDGGHIPPPIQPGSPYMAMYDDFLDRVMAE